MPGCLPMGIGDNCVIRKCIIDKNARIGSNVKIVNKDNVQESNREDDGYVIKARHDFLDAQNLSPGHQFSCRGRGAAVQRTEWKHVQ